MHCRVFPGSASSTALVLSARRGQHGQGTASIGRGLYMERLIAGSTAAARKCLLITRKIMIPPPNSWDPPDGPLYFAKKMFPPNYWDPPATSSHARKCVRAKKKRFTPLTAGTHQLHLRTQGSASGQKKQNDSPPDCWDPPGTSSQARKCLTVGTHLVEAYVPLSFWPRMCMYIYTGGCRGAHKS